MGSSGALRKQGAVDEDPVLSCLEACCVSLPSRSQTGHRQPGSQSACRVAQVQEGAGEDQGEGVSRRQPRKLSLEQSLVLHTCYYLIHNLQLC